MGRGGQKRAQFKGSHVSTCWNPKMSFSLRYGVTFRGLRFGHHVSERNVSTFHVSAAAKFSLACQAKIEAKAPESAKLRKAQLPSEKESEGGCLVFLTGRG